MGTDKSEHQLYHENNRVKSTVYKFKHQMMSDTWKNTGGKKSGMWTETRKRNSQLPTVPPIINLCMHILSCCWAVIMYSHLHIPCRKSNSIYLCVQALLMDSVVQQCTRILRYNQRFKHLSTYTSFQRKRSYQEIKIKQLTWYA